MKIRNLFLASLATLAFASCSNNDDQVPNNVSVNGDIKLKVNLTALTRTADDAVKTGDETDVNTVDLYLLQGAGADQNVLSVRTLDATAIGELQGAGHIITKINGNVTGVAIVANKKEDNATAAVGTKLSDLEATALVSGIVDIQPTAAKPGVSNSPLFGAATTITDTGTTNSATGNQLYQAKIELVPTISRVQVYGKVQTTAEDFKVTRIFVDNFKKEGYQDPLFTVAKSTDLDNLLTPYTFFDKAADLQDKTKENGVYAYHIYPQEPDNTIEKPKDRGVKLIIEMQYKKGTETITEYGTFRLVTTKADDANTLTNEDLAIEAAKVYTVDLGKIDWTGDGKYVDPSDPANKDVPEDEKDQFDPGDGGDTPNADQKDLKIVVTVQTWEEVTVVPQN